MSRAALCALLGLCLLAGLLPHAGASTALPTFTVTRTADDTAPGSLRGAIAQAAAVGGVVNFQIPTSDPGFNFTTGATITLSLGPLVIPSSLSIVGPNTMTGGGAMTSGVAVNGAGQSRVFSVMGGTVSISSLTITNGAAISGSLSFPEPEGGGGILNTANLTLTNCLVRANSSNQGNGAGINNSGSGASLTLNNCTIFQNIGNFANGGGGGGIANSGTLTATGCLITGNAAASGFGAPSGGGLLNSGTAILNTCSLSGNSAGGAQAGGGGGADNSGSLTLNSCLVNGNFVSVYGGGLFNENGGTLVLSACTISNNQANRNNYGFGGGITNFGTAQITNCLVVGNFGVTVGGLDNGGTLTLINSTFTGNMGGTFSSGGTPAGGLFSGPATLVNDIFYFDTSQANGPPSPSEIVAASGTTGPTATYSDVQQATGVYPGTGNINADPQFVRNPFTNGSTDTGDEHLQPLSPAIHIGTNGPGVPLTDIEGTPRPTPPARPSMGAYEVSGTSSFSAQGGFTVTGTQNQSTGPQVVAKFLPGPTAASSFTATVDFGDGTVPMAATISPDPATSGVFDVTASHTYTSPGTFVVTVTISGPGGTPTATVKSAANIQPILASLSFPSPVEGGSVVTATVTLTGVTSSDITVGLSSSDPTVVRINRGVVVPAGSSSATFAINTFRSHVTKTVTVQATLGQVTLTKDLTITGR